MNFALSSVILTTFSTTTMAENGNPFQIKTLPQGYMLLAENTLPEPPPPPDKGMSSSVTNAQAPSKNLLKPQAKPIADIKSSKIQDGGCGAGSCAAKLNKAQGKNLAK